MTTVLIVNRDESTVAWLKSGLKAEGFRVVVARDGPTGLDLAWRERPVMILLDLMPSLPGGCSDDDVGGAEMDGCQFLRRLRRESNVGAIVLSRRDDDAIKMVALDSGADDYLTWPCHQLELLARMRAVLRRVGAGERTMPAVTMGDETLPGSVAGGLENCQDRDTRPFIGR